MDNFKEFWKALVGPANWTRVRASDMRVGDKVQGREVNKPEPKLKSLIAP